MDTLQIAVLGVGIAAIVGIIAFNKWQESRHRRRAGRAFPDNRRDPLFEQVDSEPPSAAHEPFILKKMPPDEGERGGEAQENPPLARPHEPKRNSNPAAFSPLPRQRPNLPDKLDPRLDCCIRIEAVEPIEVPRFWAAQTEVFDNIPRPLRWFAFDDHENQWRRVDGNTVGEHHWFLAALQLVDREGAINESDFLRYTRGVQRLADKFRAIPSGIPSRAEILNNAKALDRFCAEVDVQVAINVVSQQPMPATRIATLAEAEGIRLEKDGTFHARAADSRTLYILANGEPSPFDRDLMPELQTRHISLVLDVPRLTDAAREFDGMMRFASSVAKTLGGTVVDDDLKPFGQESIDTIRSRIRHYQVRMSEEGIPPGGSLARRLFSA
ncbi:MAG: ZipA [Azoarcus sp.]|nr:ZipA [Azoarcus sp.]